MIELINTILVDFFQKLGSSLPNFFGGLIILIIGLLIGGIVKNVLMSLLAFLKIEVLFEKANCFIRSFFLLQDYLYLPT